MNHTPNTEQRERAEFEAWYAKRHPTPVHENSTWAHASKCDDWEVWQAARATQAAPASPEPASLEAACRNLIDHCDKNPPMGDSLWCVQQIRDALRAPASPNTGAVPKGWKLVPIIPNEPMRKAPWNLTQFAIEPDDAMEIWKVMLDASPAAPSPSKGGEAGAAEGAKPEPVERKGYPTCTHESGPAGCIKCPRDHRKVCGYCGWDRAKQAVAVDVDKEGK